MEDSKYKVMEQSLREKDEELDKQHIFNNELDTKLQKILTEYSQFRTRAQQMMISKEEEIDKLKGRSNNNTGNSATNNAAIKPPTRLNSTVQIDLDSQNFSMFGGQEQFS
jgi:hypothetical protein